ncbi:MAG: tail fiber domain-containing protein [Ferruginibacter sp.]
MRHYLPLLLIFLSFHFTAFTQNVGIGTTTPAGKLHIVGSTDTSQLTIDANATQSGTHPIIRFRNAAGADIMHIHSDNAQNVFIGLNAGKSNTQAGGIYAGLFNSFIGANSGISNTTGNSNTATGQGSLFSNTIGNYNTANGSGALTYNTTAEDNVAIGATALRYQSFNNGGSSYISGNVAVGRSALQSNNPTSTTTGVYNTAVGYSAMLYNTTGHENTAIGTSALYSNTSGINNTATGYATLYNNNGSFNTALGYQSLVLNNNGWYNTATGMQALYNNTTGGSNTAIGMLALYHNTGGSNNIAIGYNCGTHPNTPNLSNTISIGNSGYLNAFSNQAFIGNTSTVWNGGNTPWYTYASDARVKDNVMEDVKGLDFILRLHPVTYNLNIETMRKITENKKTEDYPGKYDVEKIKQSGFLAQQVEEAAKESGYSFSGVVTPKNATTLYSLSYEQFVVPLVKAVQEQQAIIEKQNKQIEALLKRVTLLEEKL